MRFFATTAKGASAGDYFQLYFGACEADRELEELDEPSGPFLLIGRQFEFPSWDGCSVDSSEEELRGEYHVRLLALSENGLTVEILGDGPKRVEISFDLDPVEFESLRRVADVVLGLAEPFDDAL